MTQQAGQMTATEIPPHRYAGDTRILIGGDAA